MEISAGYVSDDARKKKENKSGKNYWWAYIEEIFDQLGLTGERIDVRELKKKLDRVSVLFIGPQDVGSFRCVLDGWVKGGGILIGSNTEGLEDIFGNVYEKTVSQDGGEFRLSGRFFLKEMELTKGIHSPLHPQKPLLTVSPLRLVRCRECYQIGENEGGGSVITGRDYGKGKAYYFGFDLGQTFWALHQGRPVDKDYDGDGQLRTSDAIIIEDNEPEVAYTDELLFLLQNMVSFSGMPLIHQLPPTKEGKIPDALFFYGGDDDAMADANLAASNFMKERYLPYHINIMPNRNFKFVVDQGEFKALQENGTEISMHYNFVDTFTHPSGFTEKDVKDQTELFMRQYGKNSICTTFHCCRWIGWHEPALWLSKIGVLAHNTRMRKSPPMNPVNEISFSFGTTFPFFYRADHTLGNRRIDFIDLPIGAYECGYKGEQTDFSKLEKMIDVSAHYNLIMNVFYHPWYIAKYPACQAAIDRLLEMIKERKLRIAHSTPDRVTQWWFARSRGKIAGVREEENRLCFQVSCSYGGGYNVRVPVGDKKVVSVNYPYEEKKMFSRRWVFVIVPEGESRIEIEFEN